MAGNRMGKKWLCFFNLAGLLPVVVILLSGCEAEIAQTPQRFPLDARFDPDVQTYAFPLNCYRAQPAGKPVAYPPAMGPLPEKEKK